VMSNGGHPLIGHIKKINSYFCYLTITVPASFINQLYDQAAAAQCQWTTIIGFGKGAAPLGYIQEFYKNNLIEHVKEFLFKYLIINFLYDQMQAHKLLTSGEPRLYNTHVEPHEDGIFEFEIPLSNPIDFKEWKNFPFKAPKRKNYKDIDRQVETFIKQEQQLLKDKTSHEAHIGDWVCFEIGLCTAECSPLINGHHEAVWLKIGNEEADIPFQELFVGKKVGDCFYADDQCLQEYFSNQLITKYRFSLRIIDIVHDAYFCFEDFKHHFRLKTQKDIHAKFIEVFSYRNDLSQRRGIVEEALKLLLSKHHVEAPNYLILRQQKIVLEAVQANPDYQVYKTQPNFKDIIRQLATKQVKETLLIDQITHEEGVHANNQDIRAYINLLKRPRTKEFVYFSPPPTKIDGQEMPLPIALLKQCCMREKTLNHIIFHLTRK
jgi:FKBP-type peptidyl-prolyl cis-trans isomerase (trigger factor)